QLLENHIDFLQAYEVPAPAAGPSGDFQEKTTTEETEPTVQEQPASYNREEILKKLEDNLSRFKESSKKPLEETSEKNTGEAMGLQTKEEDLIEAIKNKEKKIISDNRKKEQNELINAFNS